MKYIEEVNENGKWKKTSRKLAISKEDANNLNINAEQTGKRYVKASKK